MGVRFDVAKAERWLEELMIALALDNHDQAYVALRAGLHALRDRLTVEEAAHLAAQLPLVIRGVFFEGWHPSGKPVRVRSSEDFLALVEQRFSGGLHIPPSKVARAVFHLLQRHLTAGMMENVEQSMPKSIVDMLQPAT
jgi:uncharacterized protein (DUF2267 family)